MHTIMSEHTPQASPSPAPLLSATPSISTEASLNPEDKQFGTAAGVSENVQQNHTRCPFVIAPPQPQELTAEWTVRAQLTFARAGERVRREFSSNDPINPVRVVYKWSTLDATATSVDDDCVDDDAETTSTLQRTASSRCSSSQKSAPVRRTTTATTHRQQSFRSTTSSINTPGDAGSGDAGADSAFSSLNANTCRTGRPMSASSHKQQQHQQHYTGSSVTTGSSSVPSGSGIATAAFYGTRCRSTCNIVVSAVADFLPSDGITASADSFVPKTQVKTDSKLVDEIDTDPFTYNTTATYTVLPQKSLGNKSTAAAASKNYGFDKELALRDAFSQTSDTETRYNDQQNSIAPEQQKRSSNEAKRHAQTQQGWQRRPYEHRRLTTEGLVQEAAAFSTTGVEGNAFMPSFMPAFKSASMSRIPTLSQQQQFSSKHSVTEQQQKKPRTVHIDVYCTGSEDEDHADAEVSSSSDDDNSRRFDIDSNSTRQTVLDNEQMRLRHQRITGQVLPRRLASQEQQQQNRQKQLSSQSDLNSGHAITKSSTTDEVTESKQLLFRKHIGDQRANKLAALRQKYLRQPSDDAVSSTYPNSSHSTVRDATCSSISSAVPSLHDAPDAADSSWKETEAEDNHSIAKSDSFEYANSVDRQRIRQMERFWSHDDEQHQSLSTHSLRNSYSPTKPNYLQTISEVNSQPSSPYRVSANTAFFHRNDTINSDLENFSETDVFYAYPGISQRQLSPPTMQQQQQQLTSSPPKFIRQPPTTSLQQTSHFSRNRPGNFLQFFGPNTTTPQSNRASPVPQAAGKLLHSSEQAPQLLCPSYQPNLQRWKSETRDNLSSSITTATSEHSQRTSPRPTASPYTPSPQRCGSEAPPTTSSAATFQQAAAASPRRFDMHRHSPSVEASTIVSGYTQEYLEKARKFGKVVSTVRKPGHHVGPTKNPNCFCESCQRWLAERFQLRGRAFSLGERPILKRPTRD